MTLFGEGEAGSKRRKAGRGVPINTLGGTTTLGRARNVLTKCWPSFANLQYCSCCFIPFSTEIDHQ